MTEAELMGKVEAIGIATGRIQLAGELVVWIATHPSLLVSSAARDLALDMVAKCQEIVRAAK